MKKWLTGMLLICICLTGTSCRERKEEFSRFGIDINQMNPLVMTAIDCSSGEKVFSRDPSVISEVMALFQNMKPTAANEATERRGISFTVSTMYGDFSFGECMGERLRLNDKEYILDKDYTKKIQLLYNRLKSETENTAVVSLESISAVKPEMTYRELLDNFGPTLVTAAVDKRRAYLYQYHGRPFYILFKKETEQVGMSGEQIVEEIWNNYNLEKSLTTPPPLKGGRLPVYKQAFDTIMEMQTNQNKFKGILLNTKKLVHMNDSERQELVSYLHDKYSIPVEDSPLAEQYASDGMKNIAGDNLLVLWVEQYSYIGDTKMNFVIAGKCDDQTVIMKQMEFNLVENEWRV